jgi:hypothetical protein
MCAGNGDRRCGKCGVNGARHCGKSEMRIAQPNCGAKSERDGGKCAMKCGKCAEKCVGKFVDQFAVDGNGFYRDSHLSHTYFPDS